ncbi:MAG: oxidoreductase FAD/NAD(P)-binding domain-containing protein [Nitrospinaceae bacterium]|nr:MAG: oxidoreductase FAD/NAD(P)-binding domain-containing protein [Nitrospinaceae bacterium]
MLDIVIGLAALTFLAVLIRYVIQLIDNNARLFAITKRGYELELELTRARLEQVKHRTQQDAQIGPALWKGFRRFQIIFKTMEARHVISFYLAPVDGKPLPSFLPGQYLTFKLNIPGQPKPVIRCYSLSDSPNHPDYYRVTIKKQFPPDDTPDAPPGLSSSFFHDSLNERDVVDVKAPSGHYYLDLSKNSPVVLIGGGVGITPLVSMLNTVNEKGCNGKLSNREVWLFLGFKTGLDHVMKGHLERIAKMHKNVSLHICYSSPKESDIMGRDYHHKGRVTVELIKQILPSMDYEFYFCGPPKMMEDLHKGLGQLGVAEDSIHFEAFNSAAIQKISGSETTETESPLKVTFSKSQQTLQWNPSAGTLLAFAEENGIVLDSGCRAGNCGNCLTTIERGLVDYLVEPGRTPDARSCLACISVPKTDLTLEA